jgi:hypothetical protein
MICPPVQFDERGKFHRTEKSRHYYHKTIYAKYVPMENHRVSGLAEVFNDTFLYQIEK